MPKDFDRTRRVADVIQRELASIIQREVSDKRLGMVTISKVVMSKDLKHAKVFFTTLNEDETFDFRAKLLNEHKKQIRHSLSTHIAMKSVPELLFIYDETLAGANHLSNLIDKALRDDEANHKE